MMTKTGQKYTHLIMEMAQNNNQSIKKYWIVVGYNNAVLMTYN
jgi:hypothetical protein